MESELNEITFDARNIPKRTYHMWVSCFINNLDIIEFNVQELIYRHQGSSNGKIIFELNGDSLIYKGFEKRIEKLQEVSVYTPSHKCFDSE
jgi:hypothetical protein